MRILTKAIAFALLALVFASVATPTFAKSMMHKKGGYVHAHTMTTKTGKVVHVKGHYRHATNPGKKMLPKM